MIAAFVPLECGPVGLGPRGCTRYFDCSVRSGTSGGK